MGSRQGALAVAAVRIGIPLTDYQTRLDAGEKWCHRCRSWLPVARFGADASRGDGRSPACKECQSARHRAAYVPVLVRKPMGPPRLPRRDGDKRQARSRINHDMRMGQRPNPNTLPCTDCGHLGEDRRHEYDHHLGYAAENHYDVEPVCSRCHHARERGRRGQHEDQHRVV